MSIPLVAAGMKAAFGLLASSGAQAGLSLLTTGVGFAAAQGQADAQQEANDAADEKARQYMIEDYDQMTRMGQQETAAASDKINAGQIDAKKARAEAKVAASAGGVSGFSVQSLLGDLYGQEASIRDSVNQNLDATGQQLQMEKRGIQRNTSNQMNTRQQPNRPSAIGAVLEGASGVYGAYKDEIKIRRGTPPIRKP